MSEPERGRAVVLLCQDGREVELDGVDRPDRCNLGLVEDLLRLQLHARRLGWSIRVVEVRADVLELFELVGLVDQLDG
jgi:ABC-type transporter Mla MlaB component